MLDSWSVYLTLYWMTPRGLVICVSAIIQNDNMRSRVQRGVIQYNVRYTDHESNMLSFCIMADTQITSPSSFCIMSDTQITSPTCRHSVLCQIHLDSWSVYLTLYRMTQCWTRDLCIWHYTGWRHIGLVICVSDIYRMMPCWTHDLCIWHYTEWCHVGLMICLSNIIQNDATLDSWSVHLTLYRMMLDLWSVYLTLYRMDPCWTCDLCIWHYTE